MYQLFQYPNGDGPMVRVATFQTAEEVLAWWQTRPVDQPGEQHLLTHNGRVIAVESPRSRMLIFV